jgi:2-methylisocitrate lyase-like PEP mutase family enzyme
MKKTRVLRKLIQEKKPLFIPGAYNAMTAMILERVGFEAIYMTGYGTSLSLLGMPDAGLITLTEMVMNAKYINNAVSLPVIADADTGYGNAVNVCRTIKEYIQAGIAGMHIEDQVMPKRCGHVVGRQLISLKEASGKIRAADDVRKDLDPDFLLIARTDARGTYKGSLKEAIRRGNAYREAGADVIFVEGLTSEEEILRTCNEINAPILYNYAGISPRLSLERLAEIGVSLVIMPGITLRVTAGAVYDLAVRLKEQGLLYERQWQDDFERNHPLGNFHHFAGFSEIRKMEEKYLPEEDGKKYKGSLGYQI